MEPSSAWAAFVLRIEARMENQLLDQLTEMRERVDALGGYL
jgi:hypothetical protein